MGEPGPAQDRPPPIRVTAKTRGNLVVLKPMDTAIRLETDVNGTITMTPRRLGRKSLRM